MARKKKPKAFSAVTAVKAAARENLGMPRPTRRNEAVRKGRQDKREKHKATLSQLLSDSE